VSDVIRCFRAEGESITHSLTEGPEVFLSRADVRSIASCPLAKPDAAILHHRRQLLSTEIEDFLSLYAAMASPRLPIFSRRVTPLDLNGIHQTPEPGSFS
jgi:hypothetical protein